MFKNSFDGTGSKWLCDRCRKILAPVSSNTAINWETISAPRKGQPGHTLRFDFCDEKCRIIHLRGRKYWQRKQDHREKNGCTREP